MIDRASSHSPKTQPVMIPLREVPVLDLQEEEFADGLQIRNPADLVDDLLDLQELQSLGNQEAQALARSLELSTVSGFASVTQDVSVDEAPVLFDLLQVVMDGVHQLQ